MSRKELPRPGLVKAALAGRISNREGAVALGLTIRQFQRLKRRYEGGGAPALRHGSRERPSPHRLNGTVREAIMELLTTRYRGFNDTHLTEKLREVHHVVVSRESVRRIRRVLGLAAVHRRRAPRHRQRRPREAAMGQLLQIDASLFAWLEARGPRLTLHGAIDDATSQVLALHFRPNEDLHGYARVLQQVFTTYGVPVALYGDGINILVRNDRHWSLAEQLAGTQAPTHLGRVLQDLGIGYVQARSPQAKGRVERLWGTLQDRLVSELRLRGVATREAANAFLPTFLADFNRRFARAPGAPAAAWRRAPADLGLIVSCRYQRVVARDHTIRLGPRLIDIPPGRGGRSFAGRRVEARELLDGRVVVLWEGAIIAQQPAPSDFRLAPRAQPHHDRARALSAARRSPSARAVADALGGLAQAVAPPRRHPWQRPYDPALALRKGVTLRRG